MTSSLPKVLLKVGYACNNGCVFCHSSPHRGLDLDFDELRAKIGLARRAGAQLVVLSGGEPTIRTDLIDLAEEIASQGLRLGLVTNGRMLAYRRLADRLLDLGLDYLYLSLCGPDAATHDRHARAPAFEQFLQMSPYLNEKIKDFTINVVITNWNLSRLEEFAPLVDRLGLDRVRLKFSCLEPEGRALTRFEELVPDLSAAAQAACQAVRVASRSRPDRILALDGFPLCRMEDLTALEEGLRSDGIFAMSEAMEAELHPVDDRNRSFGRVCVGCSLRRRCRGVYSTYLERRGESELKPVLLGVPNSFDLVAEGPAGVDEPLDLRACPIRAGERVPPDPVRGLLVRNRPGRARRLLADTRDFSDETLRTALRDREQVYRDRGAQERLTDFADQLERLTLAATCRRCPLRPRCGGCFQASRERGFAQVQRGLVRRLSRLEGRILDVGCGSGPYLDALEPAIRAGRVHYLGVDPGADPGLSRPGCQFVQAAFEAFAWDGQAFDALLALRSLNHLAAPAAALARMAALVRPGGSLLLAEDVVFATLREPCKLDRVRRRSDLEFEHRFNLDLEEVRELASDCGLVEEQARSSQDNACTLWTLVLRTAG
jgi:MoaA/NifB/PqqE/SkfB family radical SAM enzyme